MDLSLGRRRTDMREREARRLENRCYYCGGMGHFVRECPRVSGGRRDVRMRGALLEQRKKEGEDSDNESAKDLSLA